MPLRIEDYALVGDTQTVALVGRDGSIDWLCFPRFDSGACFAGLLGDAENGRWLLAPVGERRASRRYLNDTLVLETTWTTPDGVVRVFDFMPPRGEAPDVVRIVEGVRERNSVRNKVSSTRAKPCANCGAIHAIMQAHLPAGLSDHDLFQSEAQSNLGIYEGQCQFCRTFDDGPVRAQPITVIGIQKILTRMP